MVSSAFLSCSNCTLIFRLLLDISADAESQFPISSADFFGSERKLMRKTAKGQAIIEVVMEVHTQVN